MSIGFGASDLLNLVNLTWTVYKSCKNAPDSFKVVAHEVLALHVVLKELEEALSPEFQSPSNSREERFIVVVEGCTTVLKELEALVDKYQSLGTQTKRVWDRLRWHANDIEHLRSRLVTNITLLNAFLCITHTSVQRKLDQITKEFKDGRRPDSILSGQTADSLDQNQKKLWRAIRKELQEVGLTVEAFDANKAFIMDWLSNAFASGVFSGNAGSTDMVSSTIQLPPAEEIRPEDDSEFMPDSPSSAELHQDTEEPLLIPAKTTHQRNLDRSASKRMQKVDFPEASTSTLLTMRADSMTKALPHVSMDRNMIQLAEAVNGRNVESAASIISAFSTVKPFHPHFLGQLMMDAALSSQGDMVTLLLNSGASPNALVISSDSNHASGDTALHLLARSNDNKQEQGWSVEVIGLLLIENGAKINAVNTNEDTPLHVAARYDRFRFLKLLVKARASLDVRDRYGRTPLNVAAGLGLDEIANFLVSSGADVNVKDFSGGTALHAADETSHLGVVRMLISAGADFRRTAPMNGELARVGFVEDSMIQVSDTLFPLLSWPKGMQLHAAARAGDCVETEHLLHEGADIEATDIEGCTALHFAAIFGQWEVLEILLDRGANVHARHKFGRTALGELNSLNGQERSMIDLTLLKGWMMCRRILTGDV